MKLQTFDFNSNPVRVVMMDDAPWFVAVDVCRVLEIVNSRDALSALEEDEKGVGISDTPGGSQKMNIVSESGLYALIFKSRKAEAKKFRKWVTSEVLPELRRSGFYKATTGGAYSSSILAYVQTECADWDLERQMEFGMMVRRYAKAMGVVFRVEEDAVVGRVFVFPRPVLDHVRGERGPTGALPGTDARDLECVIMEMLAQTKDDEVRIKPDVLLAKARSMGLFPEIFHPKASLCGMRSAFGKLCNRHTGTLLPKGHVLRVAGHRSAPVYVMKRNPLVEALAA